MNKRVNQYKYPLVFIAFVVMGAFLTDAYLKNLEEDREYTRTMRHVVVKSFMLYTNMLSFQQKYHSFNLGNPNVNYDDLQSAHGIVASRYRILTEGEVVSTLSFIEGINEEINHSLKTFQKIEPYITHAKRHDGHLEKVDGLLENTLLEQTREIVRKTRIGTNWKSNLWENATKESRRLVKLAVIGMILLITTLMALLILQFRATREALIRAEQAKVTKAKFLTVAGHDLRQPLQASSLLLSTLQATAETPANTRLFTGIHHSLESITELLNGMLDISRLDADLLTVNKEPIAVTPLVNKMRDRFEEQARTKQLKLTLINPEDTYINSDELLLERIISNLLSNAINYTQQGEITLAVKARHQSVYITVQDTGPGITQEDQAVIFNEFIQLDNSSNDAQKGLGLGLSIVKRLCALLDHTLTLSSTVGEGSRFETQLLKAKAPPLGIPDKQRDQWSLNGVTIIIIEDDQDILSSFDLLLNTWGCHVITASTLEQAVSEASQLQLSYQAGQNDLLIISDYYLNRGYNGCDVIDAIKQILSTKIPAMVITAETDPDRLEEIRQTGNSVFRKPLKPATLRVAIQRLLRQL